MAGEAVVGVAYVIIKANTSQLAGDIGDGFRKGAKDADSDIQKSGRDSGDSYKKGVDKSLGDGDLIEDIWDPPDASKRVSSAGVGHSKSYRKGVEKENKKNNPFESLLTSLDKVGSAIPGLPPIAWGGLLGIQFLGDAANIIGSVLAGATAAVGYLATAAVGAGAALAGMAVVAIPGLGVLAAALKVNTEELEAFKKEAADLGEPFKEIASATQRELFPALLRALETMQQFIPLLSEFGARIGGIVGKWVDFGAAVLTTEDNMVRLASILDESTKFFDTMGEVAVRLIDALMPFFAAVAPLANDFADSLLEMVTRFQTFMHAAEDSGQLSNTLNEWWERAKQVGRILADVATGLWNILTIAGGSDFAADMFGGLEEAAQSFRDWTVNSAADIQAWFDKSQPLFDEVWALLTDIADIVIGPIFEGDNTATIEFVRTIREDWLPIFERLGDIFKSPVMRDAILNLADAFVNLVDAMSGGGTFTATLDALAWSMNVFADVMALPIVQEIAPILFKIAGALKVMSMLGLGPLISALPGIAMGIAQFGAALLGLGNAGTVAAGLGAFLAPALVPVLAVLAALAVVAGAVYIAFRNWDTIVGWLKTAWEWFTKLSPPIKILVGALTVLFALSPTGMFITGVLAITAALKNWRDIPNIVRNVANALKDFFTAIPRLIGDLPGMIGDFVTGLPEMLSGLGDGLQEKLLEAIRSLPGAVLDAIGALWEIGSNIMSTIADGLAVALPAIAEFFASLPFKIIKFVGQGLWELLVIGTKIIASLVKGLVQALPEVLTFFIKLPFEILTLLRKGIVGLVRIGYRMVVALINGLQDAWPRMKKWFSDLPENIKDLVTGAAMWLIRVGSDIVDGIWQGLQTGWDNVSNWFADLPDNVKGFVGDAATWLIDVGRDLMGGLEDGIGEVWASINEAGMGIPQKIVDWFADLPSMVGEALSEFYDEVISWFTDLWDELVGNSIVPDMVNDIVDWFFKLPGMAFDALVAAAGDLLGWFTDLPTKIFEALGDAATWLLDLGGDIIQGLWDGIQTVWDNNVAFWSNLGSTITGAIGDALSWLLQKGRDIIQGLWDGIQEVWDREVAFFTNLGSTITGGITGATEWLLQLGRDIIQGLWNGIQEAWDTGKTFFENLLTTITTAIGDVGSFLWDHIGPAFDEAFTSIETWGADVIESITTFVGNIPGAVSSFAGNLMGGIRTGITQALGAIGSFVTDALGRISGFASSVAGAIGGFAGNLLGGIRNGVSQALSTIGGFVAEGLGKIASFASGVAGAIGGFASNLLGGIRNGVSQASSAISSFVSEALGKISSFASQTAGRIGSFASNLLGGIRSGLSQALSAIGNFVSEGLNKIGSFASQVASKVASIGRNIASVATGGLLGANGGIFNHATNITIGEAGTEALIPVTRPARALHLMHAAGLDRMVLNAYLGGGTDTPPKGEVTMLKIEKATFQEPVDADLVAAKINSAYRRAS